MTPARPAPVVVLVGPPGAGKSTIGRKLARALGCGFADTDLLVEDREGRRVPEIFAADGEPRFREIEEEVVGEALSTVDGVLALGGGSVLSARTRDRLRGARVVHLTLGVAEGVRRSHGTDRPLLAGGDTSAVTARYMRLLTDRAPLYREVAWTAVSTERRSTGKVVREILDHLAGVGVVPTAPATDAPDVEPAVADETAVEPAPSTEEHR